MSFIVPTLNEEKYIKRCIKSIFAQETSLDFEVIVSDGGSSDKTREIAAKLGAKVVVAPKRGIAFGRNYGAKFAKGKLLVFVDADTVLPRNYLEVVLNELAKRKAIAATARISYYSKGSYWEKLVDESVHLGLKLLEKLGRPRLIGINTAVLRWAFEAAGGFPEVPSEDITFASRLRRLGKIIYIDRICVRSSPRRIYAQGLLGISTYYLVRDVLSYKPELRKLLARLPPSLRSYAERLSSYKLVR